MARVTYEQAREDHGYLWAIGEASDMTGGYLVDEEHMKLLANPTKATARKCYVDQICHWFNAGTEAGGESAVQAAYESDPKVREIAERYGCR